MKPSNLSDVSTLQNTIRKYYDDAITDTNSNATDIYNTLTNIAANMKVVSDKVSTMADMMTDLSTLNGGAQTIKYLTTLPVISNKNITRVVIEGTINFVPTTTTKPSNTVYYGVINHFIEKVSLIVSLYKNILGISLSHSFL